MTVHEILQFLTQCTVVNITGTDGTPSEEQGFVMMQQARHMTKLYET